MTAIPRLDTLATRLEKLERAVGTLQRTTRLNSASIGEGGLTIRDGGDIFLLDEAGEVVWQASLDPLKTRGAWAENDGISIPDDWTVLGFASTTVPVGFIGEGHFLMMVSVGDTMSGFDVGSVSCQPLFRYRYQDNSVSGWYAGPAIASPENRITVASSFWATNFGMDTSVKAVEFGVNGVRSFGAEDPGNGNWHVAASVIFKKGGTLE